MGLEFIYGPGSCDHGQPLVEKAAEWLQQDGQNEVFYLVPNHIKFETEVSVLNQLHQLPTYKNWEQMTTLRLQVFSFTRLAWYFLQHTPLYQENNLSEAGIHMLLRKLILEQAENLQVFRGEIDKVGFIKQLADLFSELQGGGIEAQDLQGLITSLGSSSKAVDFKQKLKEFQLLYEAYERALIEREVGTTQLISQLADFLLTKDLSHVMFIVSGFSRFTAREKQLITALIKQAAEVKISLVLDRGYATNLPESFDMFFDAGKLYFEMYQVARQHNVKVYQDMKLTEKSANDFSLLDEFWRESQKLSTDKVIKPLEGQAIQIWEGDSQYSEISHIAKEIRRLVATEGSRYQDIELLTRDLPHYENIIGPLFKTHDIPFYLNRELEMKHHPLVEFLTALFAMKQRFFRYTDVMRFLRTELFIPLAAETTTISSWQEQRDAYRNKIDITENVALAYGYEGFYWTQEKDWVYVFYDFEQETSDENQDLITQKISNSVRQDLRKQVVPFFQQLDQVKTGREGATLLYQFLMQAGVEAELIFWRNQEIEVGQLESAKAHEQTWQAFIQLLDEYVAILGEEPFVLTDFIAILTSGLDGLSYSKVPTTIDQVSVSSLDLIHAKKNKVTFMIGTTAEVLPKKIENKSLLSDEERNLIDDLLEEDKYLIKHTSADLAKEPYIAYLGFQSATERLYLTYPSGTNWSKDVKISPYVALLAKKLNIPIQRKLSLPKEGRFNSAFIGTYRQLITDLNGLKRQAEELGASMSPIWLALEKRLLKHPDYVALATQTFSSLTHQNISEALTPTMVEALYGEGIYGSVSKIESFHQCQYKYFMNYGLKLKERETFALSAAATGDFYHDALDQLFKILIREKLMLSQLSAEKLRTLTEEVLGSILGESKFAILNASHRMNYIRYQLSQTIQRVSWALQKQSHRTGLSTVQTEVLFGQIAQQEGLDSLTIDLANKKKMSIRGKIDRLDRLDLNDQTYLAVVDYKSSRHTFDYRDAYFGLAMQMITYLDVAMQNAVKLIGTEQVKPAGAFYLQVQNPTIEGNLAPEAASESLLKEYGYQGILLNDTGLLEQLDETLELTPKSSVFPYSKKKNGDFTSSQFVTETEIELLIKHNRQKFKEAGQAIFAGETKLDPAYRDKQRVACQYCTFRSVCQFDAMLKENQYHRIDKMKKADVMAKINQEAGGSEHDGEA